MTSVRQTEGTNLPDVLGQIGVGQRRSRDFTLRRLLALGDAVGIGGALAGALLAQSRGDAFGDLAWGLLALPAWIVLFKVYGLYDRDAKRVSPATVDDIPWLFHALVTGTVGLWLFYQALSADRFALREASTFFLAGFAGVLLLRAAARALARLSIPPERVLFVGGGPMARLLMQKIRSHPEYELTPIGYVDTAQTRSDGLDVPYLGTPSDLESLCTTAAVDRVVIVAPALDEPVLTDLIRRTKNLEIRISILPQVVDVLGPAVEIDDVEGITVLGINPPALTRSSQFLKRTMDVVLASAVLIVFLPVMAAIAVVIKLTSPGPVFYAQERVGRGGRRFRIYKFRTMVRDADAKSEELRKLSAHPAWLMLDHDPRITPFGRVLRHTSLDELPQLWNVLRGDMSLVGPRPMPPDVDELIYGWGRRRLDLTPGVTGLWQVLGRTNIPFEEMVKLDYLYVTNWSLWQDIRLLIHTLPAVLGRRGVN